MHLHHLNCISTCPLGGRIMDGRTNTPFERAQLTCHCLLVVLSDRLVLVDTGLGLKDVANPRSRLSAFFLGLVSPDMREEMTAFRQVQALGYDPADVRDIVLTHLDFDHAGGLDDFPGARVHLLARESEYALQQKTWMDRQRFRPQQWSSRPHWIGYAPSNADQWHGFDCIGLEALHGDIVLVPMPGHTFGHAAVAVRQEAGWSLLCGDAYFHEREMDVARPSCPVGLRLYQWMLEKDRAARLLSQQRLRQLAGDQDAGVRIFCSHDLAEFERCSGRPAGEPATRGKAGEPFSAHGT